MYICAFFSCTDALVSVVGNSSVVAAQSALTTKAIVLKEPKTDWARFRQECMVESQWERRRIRMKEGEIVKTNSEDKVRDKATSAGCYQ